MGVDNLGGDAMLEDWVKQFEELAGSQDMESIVETMMQQLLSKEILHEPMKEIGECYPIWLEENKAKLTDEEYARYSHQYELIKDLNQVYVSDPNNFNKIVELMQKMQECGQPPNDIVQELAPEFDLSNLGQLCKQETEDRRRRNRNQWRRVIGEVKAVEISLLVTKDDFFPKESFKSTDIYMKALRQTPVRLVDQIMTMSNVQTELEVKAQSANEMKKTLSWWDLMWFGMGAVIGSKG